MRVRGALLITGAAAAMACVSAASGDVFNMGGGLTSLEFVTVGNTGNAADSTGYGAVDYEYRIGKFEVTAAQYCEFLNAVAKTDTYGLYHGRMWTWEDGCKIQQGGSPGSYTYGVDANWTNRPVNYVDWFDAIRFCNWLTNGQPDGNQDASTTEDGSYLLTGQTGTPSSWFPNDAERKPNARYVLPSENEWYKAAYYDPNKPGGPGYWVYPTGTDAVPDNALVDPDPGNNANFHDANATPYASGFTIGSPYYRTNVGAFENSPSPYGTFDQGGNVAAYSEDLHLGSPLLRGGAFADGPFAFTGGVERLLKSCRPNVMDGPLYGVQQTGIRVVEVPEPATVALVALGIPLLRRRKRGV
ncbi:MAG TPA: SUMF1/EgtB/PvdO family nonheme iron enzyme [Phycisphaerae bacterium]|nr:SUMF1/EgtB/PvdO family nonheme iron enzyme [Phycisphaerae bacterium]